MPDQTDAPAAASRLSVFALDRATGGPVARLPVYVEILWVDQQPPAEPQVLEYASRALALADSVCGNSTSCTASVTKALSEAAAALWPDGLPPVFQDVEELVKLLAETIEAARDRAGVQSLAALPTSQLRTEIQAAMREVAERRGIPVEPVAAPTAAAIYPLGVLASDHVGYLSYDLGRLPAPVLASIRATVAALRSDPAAETGVQIWLHPLSPTFDRFEALTQRRFAHDAIVMRMPIAVPAPGLVVRGRDMLSMQSPGLTDWRISPASFAGNPQSLVGADGCETLLPANLATQEFEFYQVLRLTDVDPEPAHEKLRLGVAHEFRHTWYPLGHSLGQILYSLPLAPGESVNLAVIDWTRQNEARRDETTTVDEQLVHDQRRERTITETVKAAIAEHQSGSSFMAGLASSAGASGTLGAIGVAAGLAWSLGGSSSDSEGSRTLAGETVQKLSDHVAQASAAKRELQSTVVVRSTQSEREAIETRTVANYNHSHTLTVLYYEVLRHFRTVTRLARRRPVVLVRTDDRWLNKHASPGGLPHAPRVRTSAIVANRWLLEPALLDPKLAEGFAAAERVQRRTLLPPPPPPPDPAEQEMREFNFSVVAGGFVAAMGNVNERVDVHGTLEVTGWPKPVTLFGEGGPQEPRRLNHPGAFRHPGATETFRAEIPVADPAPKWRDLQQIKLAVHKTAALDDASFAAITITTTAPDGTVVPLVHADYSAGNKIFTGQVTMLTFTVPRPPPRPTDAASAAAAADDALVAMLADHLQQHEPYYRRVVLLGQHATMRARTLEAITLTDGSSALDHVENRPLEMIGDWVAYPCRDREWTELIQEQLERTDAGAEDRDADERLVTLPTRGIFADAKLGNCNVSEEIDNTRFWDWQQSPIPHFATQIMPIQAATPQSEKQDLGSTPLPSSLINIVNPPAAPDPTGMTSALSAITTPNIFRDMSGSTEVADLLKRLSDNTISIAEAANTAKAIQRKQASAGGGGGSAAPSSSTPGGIGGPRAQPNQGSAVNRDLHDRLNVLRRAVDEGRMTPEGATQSFQKTLAESSPEANLRDLLQQVHSTDASQNVGAPPAGDDPYVVIHAMSSSGTSHVLNTPLGVNPGGRLVNAVDISARNTRNYLEKELGQARRHVRFRWRQTVSQTGFQKVANVWKQEFHTLGSEPDDPDPQSQTQPNDRGWMWMYDSPGWFAGPSTRRLDLGGGNHCDTQATEVAVKMFLQAWVEGMQPSGVWERVSDTVFQWYSGQWLKRANQNADWQTTPNCKLLEGREAYREFTLAPDEVQI